MAVRRGSHAVLGPSAGPASWRTFCATLELGDRGWQIASRAHDSSGNVQPARSNADRNGYAVNGWLDHTVAVSVEPTVHPVRVTFPLLITGLPRSAVTAVTNRWSPSFHTLITRLSPG